MLLYANRSQQGMVLVIVLIFFQIITILGLYLAQTSLLSQKMNLTYWRHYLLFLAADKHLRLIEASDLFERQSCRIEIITRHELLSKSDNWWQFHSCTEKKDNVTYYYVIESFNSKFCARVSDNKQSRPIRYFRVTLVAHSKNKVLREILQSVVIKLDNAKPDCTDDHDEVMLGRQSWQRL
jgi:Tfp pilus assembly protein PilX